MRKAVLIGACTVIAMLAVGTAGAEAYTLGPAGSAVSGTGNVGENHGSYYDGFIFGPSTGAYVNCTSARVSGVLDGGPTVKLSDSFSGCSAVGFSTATATVSAPGGMVVSVTSSRTDSEGHRFYDGQLTSGSGGLSFKVGSCTLTVPPEVQLVSPKAPERFPFTAAGPFLTGTSREAVGPAPYTGSSGCPASQIGYHVGGFGIGWFPFRAAGFKVS